jgi:hypothetical protein
MTQTEIKQAIITACNKYDFETVSQLVKSLDEHQCTCGRHIDWLRIVQNKNTCIVCDTQTQEV